MLSQEINMSDCYGSTLAPALSGWKDAQGCRRMRKAAESWFLVYKMGQFISTSWDYCENERAE